MSPLESIGRRSFIKQAAAAGVAAPFFVRNLISAPPSRAVRLASFGAAGMAYATLDGIATHPDVTLECVAEVDATRLERLRQKYPKAVVYEDWREMLRKHRKSLDAACVGTPDHMHAAQAMSAMNQGLHVYVQKPLAHDIYEVRRLRETARKKKLVTQMGIQIHSRTEYRTAVRLIQDGAIGKVKGVHSWSGKKWGQAEAMPGGSDPVPAGLNWDQWLGVAAARPYLKGYYHPSAWRRRVDFGTATFGDMGCHILDPVFGALELTAPVSVRSEGPAPSAHSWAINTIVRYVFPATRFTTGGPLAVSWYDGEERPPADVQALMGSAKLPEQGSIFIGEKGAMLLPHVGAPVLAPAELGRDLSTPPLESLQHYHQFVEAIQGKGSTTAGFDYSGPLTEAVLLGPLATRFPRTTLEWDAKRLAVRNSKEATRFLRRRYRQGWKVKGLG
jgi:predicted dehydrogenase